MLDRSTAYPAVRLARGPAGAAPGGGGRDRPSSTASAPACWATRSLGRSVRARAPLVLNPQGLEEFGGTGQRFAGRFAEGRWATRRCAGRSARAPTARPPVIATDRSIEPSVRRYLGVGAARWRRFRTPSISTACESLAGPAAGHHMRRFVPAGTRVHPAERRAPRAEQGLPRPGRGAGALSEPVLVSGCSSATDRSRPTLEQQIAALGLADHVRLMGRTPTEDLHAWYEAADLFVHPTLYEGSSLVTLEAMAHRRAGRRHDGRRPARQGAFRASPAGSCRPGDAAALAGALREAMSRREQPDGAWATRDARSSSASSRGTPSPSRRNRALPASSRPAVDPPGALHGRISRRG